MTAQCLVCGLGLVHQSMRQAARAVGVGCSGGTAQGTCRPETPARRSCGRRADPLGERDGAVRDTERRAGDALQTMTAEEGLSLRQCGRLVRQLRPYGAGGVSATPTRARPAMRQRPMCARHMHRLAFEQRSGGHPGRRCGRGALQPAGPREDDAFTERAMLTACPEPLSGTKSGPDTIPLGFVELSTRRLRCLSLTDSRRGGALGTHDRGQAAIPDQRWNRLG
jgi:hypothetical protein